jgi:Flp pilus assembly protein TadD
MTTRTNRTARMLALAAGTALASTALAGCATHAAPRADLSASRADVALQKGRAGDAVANAEAAVLADPQNAGYRTMLGAAYMKAGRFQSAKTSFDDAMALGDESARTVLGYALAAIAAGDRASAVKVLSDYQDDIPAADLGLALALAGDTQQGVYVLSNAIRGGDDNPKTRQNLAYAMALNGNWAGARLMASADVPADQLDKRLAQWAELAQADQGTSRVAALLGTQAVADAGQPIELALANNPSTQQLAAEAAASSAAPVADARPAQDMALGDGELPPVGAIATPSETAAQPVIAEAPAPAPSENFAAAFATPNQNGATAAQMIAAAGEFVSQPMVQAVPERVAAAERVSAPKRPAPRAEAAAVPNGSHLVQLGSFSTEQSARRAWAIYAKQFPQLSSFDMVITKAVVRGKTYYRVNAGGMQRADASRVCSSVRGRGQECFAWTEGRPLPGALDRGTRMALR